MTASQGWSSFHSSEVEIFSRIFGRFEEDKETFLTVQKQHNDSAIDQEDNRPSEFSLRLIQEVDDGERN